jgi:hypothetical protein
MLLLCLCCLRWSETKRTNDCQEARRLRDRFRPTLILSSASIIAAVRLGSPQCMKTFFTTSIRLLPNGGLQVRVILSGKFDKR